MLDFAKRVTVVMTVKNDPAGCRLTLSSLLRQTRPPDEIVVVDGGSTDETAAVVRQLHSGNPTVRLIVSPGANIAAGRNIGTQAAVGEIVATTDAGCRAAPDWLANLVRPFDEDPNAEFVAGLYRVEGHTLFETVVGLTTMRGQLDPVCPETFNPSGRSLAYTKAVWSRAGGWPEWVDFSEDTLFDHKMRQLNVQWRFAGDAVVDWRPRRSLHALARQFYHYGTGRGHTQIGAADFAYNLRNLAATLVTLAACLVTRWAIPLVVVVWAYFYVWTFHQKAVEIVRHTRRRTAYPLCLCVTWVVLFSNLTGYLVGSWQRWIDRDRYQHRMRAYLGTL